MAPPQQQSDTTPEHGFIPVHGFAPVGHGAAATLPPPALPNPITQVRDSIDQQLNAPPTEPGWQGEVQNFGQHAARTLLSPILHPLDTAKGIYDAASTAGAMPLINEGRSVMRDYRAGGIPRAVSGGLGDVAGMAIQGGMGELGGEALGAAGSGLREAAMGDPDVAALRGLGVTSKSPKALSTLSAVEGARPYLKGVQSLEDLQGRIPLVKNEIWGPYQEAVENSSPEVQQLEARRQEISAQLRTLKQGGPEAVALAQQKGLTQAGLLAEEKAIKTQLDPELQKAGVDPAGIRKAFSQVSTVGNPKIMGRSTLAERPQPYGFGRMTNITLAKPRTWFGEPAQGVRDLAAGRPLWSGSPTDVNLREAFRTGGPKPDFRAPMPKPLVKPLQLEANVPGNADYGDEGLMSGPITGTPAPRVNTPEAPIPRLRLPASTTPGRVRPMIWGKAPYHGEYLPMPEETTSPIWPPGSEFQGEEEPDYFPRGSKFNKPLLRKEEQ
jgi:hypothetical protein